jgi:hypothetical protein
MSPIVSRGEFCGVRGHSYNSSRAHGIPWHAAFEPPYRHGTPNSLFSCRVSQM